MIGALPNLTLARSNHLLLPVTFWGLFAATVLVEFSKQTTPAFLSAIAISVFVLWSSAFGSAVLQPEHSQANLVWICEHTKWVYGKYAHATIPDSRRSLVKEQLSGYGINSMDDFQTRWPVLVEEAKLKGRYGANEDGLPFIPRLAFISFPYGTMSCVEKIRQIPAP